MVNPYLVEDDDLDSYACGKCDTHHMDEYEAQECCTKCWKCGLRMYEGNEEGESCCPCECGDCGLDETDEAWEFDEEHGDDDIFTRAWDSMTEAIGGLNDG